MTGLAGGHPGITLRGLAQGVDEGAHAAHSNTRLDPRHRPGLLVKTVSARFHDPPWQPGPASGRFVVVGSVNMDLATTAALPRPGETVLGNSFTTGRGGKGANQAIAAARAGGPVCSFIGAVGDDDFGCRAARRPGRGRRWVDRLRTVPGPERDCR